MLEVFPSKFNGLIKVKKYFWVISVWVGGYQQSGPLVENVWRKALGQIFFTPKNILILGFGCGSAAKVISNLFPAAKITGVEIDPVMLKIGKKYFPDNFSKTKIIRADAGDFLWKNKEKFDLVLVDCYLGGKQVSVRNLKRILEKDGVILMNKLENLKNEIATIRRQK